MRDERQSEGKERATMLGSAVCRLDGGELLAVRPTEKPNNINEMQTMPVPMVTVDDIQDDDICSICKSYLLYDGGDYLQKIPYKDDNGNEIPENEQRKRIIITSCDEGYHSFHTECLERYAMSEIKQRNTLCCPDCKSLLPPLRNWPEPYTNATNVIHPAYADSLCERINPYNKDSKYDDYENDEHDMDREQLDIHGNYDWDEKNILRRCPFTTGIMINERYIYGYDDNISRKIIYRRENREVGLQDIESTIHEVKKIFISNKYTIDIVYSNMTFVHIRITSKTKPTNTRRFTILYDTVSMICHLLFFCPHASGADSDSEYRGYSSCDIFDETHHFYDRLHVSVTTLYESEIKNGQFWLDNDNTIRDKEKIMQTYRYERGDPMIDIKLYSHLFESIYRGSRSFVRHHNNLRDIQRKIIDRDVQNTPTFSSPKDVEKRLSSMITYIIESECTHKNSSDGSFFTLIYQGNTEIIYQGSIRVNKTSLIHYVNPHTTTQYRNIQDADKYVEIYYEFESNICNMVFCIPVLPREDPTFENYQRFDKVRIVTLKAISKCDISFAVNWLNESNEKQFTTINSHEFYIPSGDSIFNTKEEYIKAMYDIHEGRQKATPIQQTITEHKDIKECQLTKHSYIKQLVIPRSKLENSGSHITNVEQLSTKIDAILDKNQYKICYNQHDTNIIHSSIEYNNKRLCIHYDTNSQSCRLMFMYRYSGHSSMMICVYMYMIYYKDIKIAKTWLDCTDKYENERIEKYLASKNTHMSEFDIDVSPHDHPNIFGYNNQGECNIELIHREFDSTDSSDSFIFNDNNMYTIIKKTRGEDMDIIYSGQDNCTVSMYNRKNVNDKDYNRRVYFKYDPNSKLCRIKYMHDYKATTSRNTNVHCVILNSLKKSDIQNTIKWIQNIISDDDIKQISLYILQTTHHTRINIKPTSTYVDTPQNNASPWASAKILSNLKHGRKELKSHITVQRGINDALTFDRDSTGMNIYDVFRDICNDTTKKHKNLKFGRSEAKSEANPLITLFAILPDDTDVKITVKIVYDRVTDICYIMLVQFSTPMRLPIPQISLIHERDTVDIVVLNRLKRQDILKAISWLTDETATGDRRTMVKQFLEPTLWMY